MVLTRVPRADIKSSLKIEHSRGRGGEAEGAVKGSAAVAGLIFGTEL